MTVDSRGFPATRNYWVLYIGVAACLLALVLVGATLVIGRLLPEQVQVAYESSSIATPQQRNIYLMDIQRTLPVRLTGRTDNVLSMNWSPDGNRAVYVTAQGSERPRMFILDLHGRRIYPVSLDPYPIGSTVNWSPDGRSIVLMAAVNNRPRMVVLDIQSGTTHILDVGDNLYRMPTWSPDSRSLLYLVLQRLGVQDDRPVLYAVPIACQTTEATCAVTHKRLLPTYYVNAYSWSEDGTTMVFNGTHFDQIGVHLVNLSCTDVLNNCLGEPELLKATSFHTQPFWSPLGTQIAYRDYLNQINVIDMKTRTARQFVTTGGVKNELLWTKDGEELIYEAHATVTADLFALNLLTGKERQLTTSVNEDHRPKLRPDQ